MISQDYSHLLSFSAQVQKKPQKQPPVHSKTPQHIFTENLETAHSKTCTTWQHTASIGFGQYRSGCRFTIFHKNCKRTKRLFVSEEGRSRVRLTQQEGDRWLTSLEMCCCWSVGHQLLGVSYGPLKKSCFPRTTYLESLGNTLVPLLHQSDAGAEPV